MCCKFLGKFAFQMNGSHPSSSFNCGCGAGSWSRHFTFYNHQGQDKGILQTQVLTCLLSTNSPDLKPPI